VRLFGNAEIPIVIATARLTPNKRFDLLVRALGVVRRRGGQVNLLIVGDGPERQLLEALAQEEGVRAIFTGACYEEHRLAEFFASATVTVSPGEIGLTCMHSLGYGVPVITHNDADHQMPEWEAVLPGVTGDTFEKNNLEDLADKIEQWTRTPIVPMSVRTACLSRVAQHYHPRAQAQIIELALRGLPAPISHVGFHARTAAR
jgi:glycosyltransferase involved in cell wall biosynthesis